MYPGRERKSKTSPKILERTPSPTSTLTASKLRMPNNTHQTARLTLVILHPRSSPAARPVGDALIPRGSEPSSSPMPPSLDSDQQSQPLDGSGQVIAFSSSSPLLRQHLHRHFQRLLERGGWPTFPVVSPAIIAMILFQTINATAPVPGGAHPCGLCKGGAVRKVLESAAVECDDHEGSISSSTIPFFQ